MGLDSYVYRLEEGKVKGNKTELFYFRKCWTLQNVMAGIWADLNPDCREMLKNVGEPVFTVADDEEKRKSVRRQLYQTGNRTVGEKLKESHENDVYVLIEKNVPNYHLLDFCSFNGQYIEISLGMLRLMKDKLKPWIDTVTKQEKEYKAFCKKHKEEYEPSWDYSHTKNLKKMFKVLKSELKKGKRIAYVASF